jgi:hypothetical protein
MKQISLTARVSFLVCQGNDNAAIAPWHTGVTAVCWKHDNDGHVSPQIAAHEWRATRHQSLAHGAMAAHAAARKAVSARCRHQKRARGTERTFLK